MTSQLRDACRGYPPVHPHGRPSAVAAVLCKGRVHVRYSSQNYLAAFNSPGVGLAAGKKKPRLFPTGGLASRIVRQSGSEVTLSAQVERNRTHVAVLPTCSTTRNR